MSITKDDFYLWKSEPLTMAWFEACTQRIEDTKDLLSVSAGQDIYNDNFNRGFIAAYREMMNFQVEDLD